MSENLEDVDLISANRDYAFPPLQAEDDDGSWDTEFKIIVPFAVNQERWKRLGDSLLDWARVQGLSDFLDPETITIMIRNLPKVLDEE